MAVKGQGRAISCTTEPRICRVAEVRRGDETAWARGDAAVSVAMNGVVRVKGVSLKGVIDRFSEIVSKPRCSVDTLGK